MEFINFLNLNQGLLGFISIIISLVGFFICIKKITNINTGNSLSNSAPVRQNSTGSGHNQMGGTINNN